MIISHTLFNWFNTSRENEPTTVYNTDTQNKKHQSYSTNIHAARILDRAPINDALEDTGWSIDSIFASDSFCEEDLMTKQRVLEIMMAHSEYKYCLSTKETIYRFFAVCDWLNSASRTKLISFLFEHFEMEEMKFNQLEDEYANDDSSELSYSDTDKARWEIGFALSCLINPKLLSHRKYQNKLSSLLHNNKYNKARSELIIPYARIAKQEAIPDLIKFLDDNELRRNAIFELGRLKAQEAIPYLEKIVEEQEPVYRNLAIAALKKIY